jgi:hypothetical protein
MNNSKELPLFFPRRPVSSDSFAFLHNIRDTTIKRRFVEEGLEVALDKRKAEREYVKKADGDFEAHLVALSCSTPPEGHARWSLRLLADQAVELGYIDSVSHETVRRVLKKTG